MGVKTFWIEPTERERVWLRRYRSAAEGNTCPLPFGYHNAETLYCDDRPAQHHGIGDPEDLQADQVYDIPSKEDVRWPTHCDCGYQFQPTDPFQVFPHTLWTGAPDGKLYTLREVPVGAMWDVEWFRSGGGGEYVTGPDGISLCVKTPGGEWMVDSECSNCPRPQWGPKPDQPGTKYWLGRTHYCWCRHGDPRTGTIHVDKNPEPGLETCAAGGGSIVSGGWHGFLHHGELSPC